MMRLFTSVCAPRHAVPRRWRVFHAVACASALLALLSACSQPTVNKTLPPPPTPTATASPSLPTFADWRAAYLAPDGNMHVVSLDGTTNLTGPMLPGMTSNRLGFASAGFSPDGHTLAYVANAGLSLVNVTQPMNGDSDVAAIYDMDWSPDGNQIALGQGVGGLSTYNLASRRLTDIPGAQLNMEPQGARNIIGWIDNTHLAVTVFPLSTTSTTPIVTLGSLNVTNGNLRKIVTLTSPNLGISRFSLSPDGTKLLFSNQQFRDTPYTPMVDLIDTATGALTPLPRLTHIMGPHGSGLMGVAWHAGTSTVAVSTYSFENGGLQTWIENLSNDTATQLPSAGYPVGWAPTGNILMLSSGSETVINEGPYTLSAVSFAANGQTTTTILTKAAMSFPFLGFVRTA